MTSVWKIRLFLGAFAAIVLVAGIPIIRHLPSMPAPQYKFIKQVHWDRRNAVGDEDFVCETERCDPGQRFIGVQTHDVYTDAGHAMAGVPTGQKAEATYHKAHLTQEEANRCLAKQ